MQIAVIGSGSIGPDLAYGFVSALSKNPKAVVYLLDIRQEALDAGMKRINGYLEKAVSKGKLTPAQASQTKGMLKPTMNMQDLSGCSYVLEAATEDLKIKRKILSQLELVVSEDCLIGFATSGIPRSQIITEVRVPNRCFVNHPFYPAWRSLPIEIVPSEDADLTQKMIKLMMQLGKVPVLTADVPCFAADDVFCNYISEAARIVEEGIATPKQVDQVVDQALGGGGPFNVMDLTRGNLLTVHCQELMYEIDHNNWFKAPEILTTQGNQAWFNKHQQQAHTPLDTQTAKIVLDRILAVLFARNFYLLDNEICAPAQIDWLAKMALGFSKGFLALACEMGMDQVQAICLAHQKQFPKFPISQSILTAKTPVFFSNLSLYPIRNVQVIEIHRPEVKNALSEQTLKELSTAVQIAQNQDQIQGIVITGYEGAIAGADIGELATLSHFEQAKALCLRGQAVLNQIEQSQKPIVMAVNGPVMGGGAELSMACHARVVGPDLLMSQPEVNLGIIPGYGGTQRLPRWIGFDKAWQMLRAVTTMNSKQAVEWGWASAMSEQFVEKAIELIEEKAKNAEQFPRIQTEPVSIPQVLAKIDLSWHSRKIDSILVDTILKGLQLPLYEGLVVEAEGVGKCVQTIDKDIGMKNFMQNGPRTPACFLHE